MKQKLLIIEDHKELAQILSDQLSELLHWSIICTNKISDVPSLISNNNISLILSGRVLMDSNVDVLFDFFKNNRALALPVIGFFEKKHSSDESDLEKYKDFLIAIYYKPDFKNLQEAVLAFKNNHSADSTP